MIELAGYEYFSRLDSPGNFGTVFHARNVLSGQDVAIKHIDERLSADALANWKAEASAMAAIDHPNVVRILHAEVTPDGPALVMEYLPDGSVASRFGDSKVPVGDVLNIGIDACWGLHRLHLTGLTHRDVKPANLLLDGQRAKLGDFGLAALESDPVDLVYIAHKPPELRPGGAWTVSADVYALGVTLWRLLSGDGDNGRLSADLVNRIEMGRWPDRSSWPSHVHRRLRAAIGAAMNEEPSKRPKSAADLRSSLEQARPVVAWTQTGPGEWRGLGKEVQWRVALDLSGSAAKVETRRDAGGGLRRVSRGCHVSSSKSEATRYCAQVLDRIATNGSA